MFDTMDASDLNKRLKDLMDGLSVKVRLLSRDAAPQLAERLQQMTSDLLTRHNIWKALAVTLSSPFVGSYYESDNLHPYRQEGMR